MVVPWLRWVEGALSKRRNALVKEACAHGPELWAEDIVHDAWASVQDGRIEPQEPLVTERKAFLWFRRIVRNQARNRRRTELVRRHRAVDTVACLVSALEVERDCLRDKLIDDAVRALPPAQREVVRFLRQGWSLSEIATATDRSASTVRQHWHRARTMLQQKSGHFGKEDSPEPPS